MAVRLALSDSNWYGALTIALTLPDICGRLEYPTDTSKKRYVNWYNRYLLPTYTSNVGNNTTHVFLSGEDCYALRCSYLHEGIDDITAQNARKALDNFHFVSPRQGWYIHRNQVNGTLQLQVDKFCEELCTAVEEWMQEMESTKPVVYQKFNGLLIIHSMDNGISF